MRSTRTKICAKCGRRFAWRKKWARDWNEIRFCSARCRGSRISSVDFALEREILGLLGERGSKTICPSEAAKRVDPESWRALMEAARQAARRLVARGDAQILQGGRPVDPSTARGPIRIAAGPPPRSV